MVSVILTFQGHNSLFKNFNSFTLTYYVYYFSKLKYIDNFRVNLSTICKLHIKLNLLEIPLFLNFFILLPNFINNILTDIAIS